MEPDEDQYELSLPSPSHGPSRSRTRRHGGHRFLPRKVNDFLDSRLKGRGRTTALALFCIAVLLFVFWPKRGLQPILKSPWTHSDDPVWSARAVSVKDAFLHAYHGYETYTTFPDDELHPISNTGQRNFNGWGVTVVDSLDTMWLMGLNDEFQRAIPKVASLDFTMNEHAYAPFFETVIRYLGGLLSAYALSNDTTFLSRADDLGTKLLPAFHTASGLPSYSVNTVTGHTKDSSDRIGQILIAEMASCQLEYRYLAHLTHKKDYSLKMDQIDALMHDGQLSNGLWNTIWDLTSGAQVNDHVGVAAWADSAYEYVLKQYLLTGKTDKRFRDMYMKATSGVIDNLLYLSPTRYLLYVSDLVDGRLTGKFEHLSCFFPGLLALGLSTLEMSTSERELHVWAAEGLAHSCWIMYADQASGLGPELAIMDMWPGDHRDGRWMKHVHEWKRSGRIGGKPPGVLNLSPPARAGEKKDYYLSVASYLSRPETLESMYVMWRSTRDVKWRDHGWEIWTSIANKTRTSSGYASATNVDSADPMLIDSMPSYFLSETMKYAYLLAIDQDPWPVDKFVFNTEAHPLPIFS